MKIMVFLRISNGANTDSGHSFAYEFIDFDTDEDYLECKGEGHVPIGQRF